MTVLHYIYGLHTGGAETFLINLLQGLKKKDIEFHFALQDSRITNSILKDIISSMGDDRVHIIPKFPSSSISQYMELKRLIRCLKPDFFHIHANSLVNGIPLCVKQKLNTKIILHSHNSLNASGGNLGKLIHKVNKKLFGKNIDIKIACSKLAGDWMYGKESSCQIVYNAIDYNKFKFDSNKRKTIRNRYGIGEDEIVLGFVGRLVEQKNPIGLINIFEKFYHINPKSKLMIVGDGYKRIEMEEQISSKNLTNNVIFCGLQSETSSFYSAMDCFLMPSFYEGLAFTAIEAQAAGLPIIASKTVSRESKLNESMKFIELPTSDANLDLWVNLINQVIVSRIDTRLEIEKDFISSNFNRDNLVKKFEEIYKIR